MLHLFVSECYGITPDSSAALHCLIGILLVSTGPGYGEWTNVSIRPRDQRKLTGLVRKRRGQVWNIDTNTDLLGCIPKHIESGGKFYILPGLTIVQKILKLSNQGL